MNIYDFNYLEIDPGSFLFFVLIESFFIRSSNVNNKVVMRILYTSLIYTNMFVLINLEVGRIPTIFVTLVG